MHLNCFYYKNELEIALLQKFVGSGFIVGMYIKLSFLLIAVYSVVNKVLDITRVVCFLVLNLYVHKFSNTKVLRKYKM